MGMFSFCCKGCGHELHEQELVRMNGCVGEYDGYGCAGGYNYGDSRNEPSCWHEACYKKATPDQKLDESPSRHAANQGFGPSCLEFMEGFDPKTETTFSILFDLTIEKDGKFVDEEAYVLEHGTSFRLESQNKYDALYAAVNTDEEADEWYMNLPPDISMEDLEKVSLERMNDIEAKIGMKNPKRNAAKFDSFEKAVEIALLLRPEGDYYLSITGQQGILLGTVYVRQRYKGVDKIEYEIGKPCS